MCCYKTSCSLNPTVSSQATHLLLGHFAFRSSAEPHRSFSWKAAKQAHVDIHLQRSRETPTYKEKNRAEIKADTQTHKCVYIYSHKANQPLRHNCRTAQVHTHTEKHTNTHTDTQNTNRCTASHTHAEGPHPVRCQSNVLSVSVLSSSLLISQ